MTARSSGIVHCPNCGTAVEQNEVHAQFVGDVIARPVRMVRCVAIGFVLGVALGVVLGSLSPMERYPELSLGALLGILVAIVIATRYNDRIRDMPVDLWPTSVRCPKCGRVFGRYKEGDDPAASVWPG